MRDLRGQRAEDVIYAGPRRAMGFAEVTLTLEAEDGDVDLQWSELAIGRRVHRSGDGEYILSGERTRLRDVTAALRDIEIDASRYVVVNQGMADALLVATPLERRSLLEHAAGLAGYRAHREEARQKLATTAQNMLTMETVLAELEPRLRLLRRQAKAVRDREEAASRLRTRLALWLGWRWAELSADLAAVEAEGTRAADERDRATAEVRAMEEAAETQLDAERSFQQKLESARASLHATERELDAARFHLQQQMERLAAAEQRVSGGGDRAQQLSMSRRETTSRLIVAERALAAATDERRQLEAEQAEIDARAATLRTRLDDVGNAHAAAARARKTREREWVRASEEVRSARAEEETLEARMGSLTHKRAALEAAMTDVERQLSATSAHLDSLQRARGAEQDRVLTAETTSDRARARLERIERLRSRARAACAALNRERESVERSLASLEEYATLAGLPSLVVPEGWERATAVALAGWSIASPESRSEEWSATELRAFLEWRSGVEGHFPADVCWADSVVAGALTVPNPLQGTLFVSSDDLAESIWRRLAPQPGHTIGSPPIQIVSRAGIRRSSLGTERDPRDDHAARYLMGRGIANVLERRLRCNGERLAALDGAAEQQRAENRELVATLESTRAKLEAFTLEQSAPRRTMEDLERRKWRLEAELKALDASAAEDLSRLEDLRARIARLTNDVDVVARELAVATRREEAAMSDLGDIRQQMATVHECREDIGRKQNAAALEEAQATRIYTTLRRDLDRLRFEESQISEQKQEGDAETSRLASVVEHARATVDELAGILEEQKARVHEIAGERPERKGFSTDLSVARSRLTTAVGVHERALARCEQRTADRTCLAAEIERELQMSAEALPRPLEDVPSDDEIRRLRSRAGQYADADESVVREFEEIEERYAHLSSHLEDLQTASSELQHIIETTDREMGGRFEDALAAVDAEFSRMFRVMLRGGEARLERVDEEGGIGVRAQLPGKRTQSSAAFSGGERALVATSLLFGVLNIRPTPFCVLDEVDAPLDESNVDRYLAALRDISTRTQMIVVTHNRATMAAADVLYGVTMDDEGVTSLLSLRLDAYDAAG
jgi:chromosome segregation protein